MNKLVLLVGLACVAGCAPFIGFGDRPEVRIAPETVEIVVEPGLGGGVAYAADELGKWLGKSLGGAIPRVEKPTPGKVALVLGDGPLVRAAGIDVTRLKQDGLVIRTAPGRVYIAGRDEKGYDLKRVMDANSTAGIDRNEHGTLNGVYEFLERFVGVRFYFPEDDLGVIVPRHASVDVPPTDLTVEPKNTIRTLYWGNDAVWLDGDAKSPARARAFGLWWLRYRMGTASIPCCHGQNGFAYSERFAKTHPEYFQMRKDGSRCVETDDSKIDGQSRQLCHSSAVWDEMYEDVKAYLTGQSAESRGVLNTLHWRKDKYGWNSNCKYGKYVDIMAQDGMERCHCPKCKAAYQDKPEFATDLIWGNTKRLAERLIAEKVPGYVTQMSYNPYRDLPSFDLPTNVLVMVAENGPWSAGNPKMFERDCSRIRAWAKKTGGNVWVWNYPGKWGKGRFERKNIPQMSPRAYAKFYKAVAGSIFGAFAESESDRAIYNYLNHYVFGRLMWDPSIDVDALLDEHYRLMFGAAAPEMKAFYEGLEDKWVNGMVVQDNVGTSFYAMPNDIAQWTKIYSESTLKSWADLFRTAASKLRKGTDEAKRLQFVCDQFLRPLIAEREKFFGGLKEELARRKSRPNASILENGDVAGRDRWTGRFEFDPTQTVTGRGSLKLTSPSNRVYCSQLLGAKLERNTRYRVSYFTKQTDIAARGAMACVTDRGADSYARTWLTHPRTPPLEAHDWLFRSYEIRTGSKPDKDLESSFGFFLDGAGTAWFDGIRIEKIEPER